MTTEVRWPMETGLDAVPADVRRRHDWLDGLYRSACEFYAAGLPAGRDPMDAWAMAYDLTEEVNAVMERLGREAALTA